VSNTNAPFQITREMFPLPVLFGRKCVKVGSWAVFSQVTDLDDMLHMAVQECHLCDIPYSYMEDIVSNTKIISVTRETYPHLLVRIQRETFLSHVLGNLQDYVFIQKY
jgi:hypothetical protein